MRELLEQFRTRRTALISGTGKRPNRYPDDLRKLALTYSQAAQADGVPHRVVAESLGIDPITLTAWERKSVSTGSGTAIAPVPTAPPKLRRVEVVEDPQPAGTLSVVGPHGLRVEGMSIEQVAVLLQRLAC